MGKWHDKVITGPNIARANGKLYAVCQIMSGSFIQLVVQLHVVSGYSLMANTKYRLHTLNLKIKVLHDAIEEQFWLNGKLLKKRVFPKTKVVGSISSKHLLRNQK